MFNIIVIVSVLLLARYRTWEKINKCVPIVELPQVVGFFEMFLDISFLHVKNKALSTEEHIQNCHFRAIQNDHKNQEAMYKPYLGSTWFLVVQAMKHGIF